MVYIHCRTATNNVNIYVADLYNSGGLLAT